MGTIQIRRDGVLSRMLAWIEKFYMTERTYRAPKEGKNQYEQRTKRRSSREANMEKDWLLEINRSHAFWPK